MNAFEPGDPNDLQEQTANQAAPPPTTWLERLSSRKAIGILAGASVLLLLAAALGAWYLLGNQGGGSEVVPQITPPASLTEVATQFPELAPILQNSKLDSVYKDFLVAYEQGGTQAAYELAHKRGLLNERDELVLTLEMDTTETEPMQAELESFGVIINAASGNLMDIAVPLVLLEQAFESGEPEKLFEGLLTLDHLVRIRLPIIGIEDVGEVESESLQGIGVDAWQAAGFTGKGVRVGVLDMGFDRYKELLGSDLPANAVVRSFIAGAEPDEAGTVHGSAVTEIIYDIAPDAEYFMAAYKTDVEERQAVEWLLSQGVDLISNSTGSIYGPMDGSSFDAQIVEEVVASGVVWINSAGNSGYTHYRGQFTDRDGDGYHEFAPGDELMAFIPSGWTVLALNWDDWEERIQDYDLFVLDSEGYELASSTNAQTGAGSDSAEILGYEFSDEGPYYIAIYRQNATRDVLFDFFMRDGEIEYYTPEYSVTTPGDASSSITVGATNWEDDALEDYSSQGPTQDGRLKPDIVAPSMVSSAAYERRWPGTSASAPHVAGAVALVLQAYPDFTPQQVAEFLKSRAIDMESGGPDYTTGYGRLWMGDPPDIVASPEPVVTEPPVTETSVPVAQLETPVPIETKVLPSEDTPTPERSPVITPSSSSGSNGGAMSSPLVLFGCVLVPGILGLAGLGLVGLVWYASRSRPAPPAVMRPPVFPSGREPTAVMPPKPGDVGGPQKPPLNGALYRPQPPRPGNVPPRPPQTPPRDVLTPPPSPKPATVLSTIDAQPGELTCPRCGRANPATARFCNACGQDLKPAAPPNPPIPAGPATPAPAFCRRCGKPLRANSKFCPNCGEPV